MNSNEHHRPLVLMILDGWGYSRDQAWNAVTAANTPVWDRLWSDCPHQLLRASGTEVGLPGGQMGNSEVGHLNIGAGRVICQEFTRVNRAIKTGSFFTNTTLTGAVDQAIRADSAVHILGLLSPGGVHSHEEHIHAMAKLAIDRGAPKVYLHAFLDGRDTPPKSASASLTRMTKRFGDLGRGQIASIIGRFYAMDRDHRWPRVQAAYDLITQGKAEYRATDPLGALEMAYAREESDEFVQATAITDGSGQTIRIEDGDAVIFMNYRSDRARQITRPFIEQNFDTFKREHSPKLSSFVTLTEYSASYDVPVAFPPERLKNLFGEHIASLGMRQLRIAETEKYAHVTFFFNGGREEPFEGEDRVLINSPNVTTYDLQPEMSAPELTDRLVEAIKSDQYDAIICNFANPDMVGHTGNFNAAVKALEALDTCLGRIAETMSKTDGAMLITADHGNAEKMRDSESGQPHTAHTSNPVPLIYVGRRDIQLDIGGTLADLAPTMLELMGLAIPAEMNGHSLIATPHALEGVE